MNRQINLLYIAAAASLMATSAQAGPVQLFDYVCNIDGASAGLGDALPANMDDSAFDDVDTGLGQIDITVTGAGAHTVICWFDHEIDQSTNTYFNEAAATGDNGTGMGMGQTWEIDEPELFGDILDNVLDSTVALGSLLDGMNAVPAGSPPKRAVCSRSPSESKYETEAQEASR